MNRCRSLTATIEEAATLMALLDTFLANTRLDAVSSAVTDARELLFALKRLNELPATAIMRVTTHRADVQLGTSVINMLERDT